MLTRLLLLIAALSALAGAQAQSPALPLVYCADGSPEGFDPGLWDGAGTNNVTRQIHQGLLGFAPGGTALVPRLATRWEMSGDARHFTFYLRDGVQFQRTPTFTPSRPLNADDVLFTFGRFIDPKHPYNRAYPAHFVYPSSLGLAQMIERIERVDAMTVRFVLRVPNVTFASYFAMPFAAIQSAEYGAQLLREGRAERINQWPVGAGPYRFRSYLKDDVLRLEPHPEYWAGRQATPALIYSITREPAVRVQKLLAGECHVTAPLRDVDVGALMKRPGQVRLLKIDALNISYLSFNLRKSPTDHRLVREALDIAIDRKAIFRAMFPRGDAREAAGPFPPEVPGYDTTQRNVHDPARARALLREAGYPNGFSLELWALPVARPTNPNGLLLAQLIQQDWAQIGVTARIKSYEFGEYLKRANAGEHDVYMSGWSSDNGDPDDFLAPNLSCAGSRGGVKFCNERFDALLAQARATTDPAQRQALYIDAQRLMRHERPWMPLAHSAVYIATRPDVSGLVMAPNGSVSFEGVTRR